NHPDDPTAVVSRGGAHDGVMPGEGRRPGAGIALGKRGAALDIGEEESHGAGRQVRHIYLYPTLDPDARRPVAWGLFFEGRVYFRAGSDGDGAAGAEVAAGRGVDGGGHVALEDDALAPRLRDR